MYILFTVVVLVIFIITWYAIRIKYYHDLDLSHTLERRLSESRVDVSERYLLYGRFVMSVKQIWQPVRYAIYAISFSKKESVVQLYGYNVDNETFYLINSFCLQQINVIAIGNFGVMLRFEAGEQYLVKVTQKNIQQEEIALFIEKINEIKK